MYRLICPVVDLALARNGLEAFFEFSQPNGPNKRLSADIALIRGEQPVWLIEAKRFTQSLHPDLVAPYLKPGMMGAVTNGNHWVFIVRGQTIVLGPMIKSNGSRDLNVEAEVVSILTLLSEDDVLKHTGPWAASWAPFERTSGPPIWRLNEGAGSREFAEKVTFEHLSDAVKAALPHVRPNSPTAQLLEELNESGADISSGSIEVSSKRLIWWLPDRRRGARLNLESSQVEMLVLNSILSKVGRDQIQASVKLHDKNHAMSTCKANSLAEVRSLVAIFQE